MDRFDTSNKNLKVLFEDDFQIFSKDEENQQISQSAWSVYNLFWGTLGYSPVNSNQNGITPVSSSRFPKVDLGQYGLDAKETLTNFKSIKVADPKARPEIVLKKIKDFLGEDYKLPEKSLEALLSIIEYSNVLEKFEELTNKAVEISTFNLNSIESKQEIDFLRLESISFIQLGDQLYEQMVLAVSDHVEKAITEEALPEKEAQERSEELSSSLYQVLTSLKTGLIHKANLMNTQLVVDVIKLGAYDLEFDKPEEERAYKKDQVSNGGTRFFSGHTKIAQMYNQLTVEEKILFDEGYEFKADESLNQHFWSKSLWEKPKANEPLVYQLHIGLAQPGGDMREATLRLDLSEIKRAPFTHEEAKILFDYLASAVDASSLTRFEEIFKKHEENLKKIDGLGYDEIAHLKEAAKQFWQDVSPTIFSVISHFGHPESESHISVSRKEELVSRANFVRLVRSRGFGWNKQIMDTFNPSFKIPEFRKAFQEFVAIIAEKMDENQFPPYGEDRLGLDKKMMAMHDALKKNAPDLLDKIGPNLVKLYDSVITGQND